MILTTHALTGAVIGKNLENPWIIIPIALALHFFLDTFRHGEYFNRKTSDLKEISLKVTLDLLIGFGILGTIIYYQGFELYKIYLILLGTLFSMFPDLLTVLYWNFKSKSLEKIYNFHSWTHKHHPFSKEREWNFRNAINDIVFSVIAIILLLSP